MQIFSMPALDDNNMVFREWETAAIIENYEGEFTYFPSNKDAGRCQMFTWFDNDERAYSCMPKDEWMRKFGNN